MGYFDALDVSASGLSVQRTRMDLISQNIANVNTTKTEEGTPYRRKALLVGTENSTPFGKYLTEAGNTTKAVVKGVYEDQSEFEKTYDPTNPEADKDGYVSRPNVNVVQEMVDMISATRSYEANVTAMNASKDMAGKAINIG